MTQDTPKFPVHFQIKRYDQHDPNDWRWDTICTVWDNEHLGLLERICAAQGVETQAIPRNP